MTKEEWIDQYVVNFMATYDANRVIQIHDELIVKDTCPYQYASKMANRAWDRRQKFIDDTVSALMEYTDDDIP